VGWGVWFRAVFGGPPPPTPTPPTPKPQIPNPQSPMI